MNGPIGVAVDGSGDLYVADSLESVIREVKPSSGSYVGATITTIAGDGSFAGNSTTDNGVAATAVMMDADGIALDSSGQHLYITDVEWGVVREVDLSALPAATIMAFAGGGSPSSGLGDGGAPAAAKLNGPFGVTVDDQGNVFIADTYDNVIREVTAATAAQTVTVTPAALTVTATTLNWVVGQPQPSFTYNPIPAGEFVNGDTPSVVTGTPSYSTTPTLNTSNPTPGTYTINIGLNTLAAPNYTFDLAGGKLTVTEPITATTTTLSALPASITYGQQEVFTATVNASPPSSTKPTGGMVTFMNNGTSVLGTATLLNGTATFSTMGLGAGTYVVTAVYGGVTNVYSGSTSTSGCRYRIEHHQRDCGQRRGQRRRLWRPGDRRRV